MSFASDMARFAQLTGRSLEKAGRAITMELFGSVIKDTPVDTGTARGNWQTTIGTPAAGALNRAGAGPAISELRSALPSFMAGKVIYLTNNLPYIYKLEYGGYGPSNTGKTANGFSIQAPEGMVRKNVARIQSIVARAARENRV